MNHGTLFQTAAAAFFATLGWWWAVFNAVASHHRVLLEDDLRNRLSSIAPRTPACSPGEVVSRWFERLQSVGVTFTHNPNRETHMSFFSGAIFGLTVATGIPILADILLDMLNTKCDGNSGPILCLAAIFVQVGATIATGTVAFSSEGRDALRDMAMPTKWLRNE